MLARVPWGHSQIPAQMVQADDLFEELERLRWPCLVLDENCCLGQANSAARRGLELDQDDLRGVFSQGNHLVEIITNPAVQSRIQNWEDAAITLLPSSVKPFLNPSITSTDASRFGSAVMNLRRRDPDSYNRLVALWERNPQTLFRLRITFPLHWRASDGTGLSFHGLVSGWAALSGYWAIDLHPANAETFEWLDRQPV